MKIRPSRLTGLRWPSVFSSKLPQQFTASALVASKAVRSADRDRTVPSLERMDVVLTQTRTLSPVFLGSP